MGANVLVEFEEKKFNWGHFFLIGGNGGKWNLKCFFLFGSFFFKWANVLVEFENIFLIGGIFI